MGVVLDKEQAAVVIAGSQRTEHLVGRLGVGPVRGPHSHRLGGSQGVEAEAGEVLDRGGEVELTVPADAAGEAR